MKNKNPKVSVVMTNYNQEVYIEKSLTSILEQTFKDFEFIIVEDCSKDKSSEIIRDYARKDKRIKVIANDINLGNTKSLNIGLKKAKGKYIAIMDSDDIALPDRLRIEYEYLEAHPNTFLVGGKVIFMDQNEKDQAIDCPIPTFESIKETFKQRNCLWHPTIMFRNEGLLYREKMIIAQDYDFLTMLVTNGKKILNIPHILIKYRIHENSTSFKKKAKQQLFVRKIAEFYKQRLETGKDGYAKFDPRDIMDYDVENTTDKELLEVMIYTNWKIQNYASLRKYFIRYLKEHRIKYKYLGYYIASLFGRKTVNLLRKIKHLLKIKQRNKLVEHKHC